MFFHRNQKCPSFTVRRVWVTERLIFKKWTIFLKYISITPSWNSTRCILFKSFSRNGSIGLSVWYLVRYGWSKLQSVTNYTETWSKPVKIFKTFERVHYIPILMPPSPNSMLRVRYKLPERQESFTQMQSHLHITLKLGGGVLVLEFLWLIAAIYCS